MFKRKKLLLIIPLILIFLTIVVIPPYKLVHLKSNFLSFFKMPLSISYSVYLTLLNTKEIFSFYADYKKIKQENKKLGFKINQLEEARLENARLRKILKLADQKHYDFTVAEVIGKEPSNWLNSLIINKGSRDGIKINQPVMNFAGLIGKIIEVNRRLSKVLLISDVNSRVVVLVQRTREEGILEGIGRGLCRLKYLSQDSDVELGDIVVSAGVGGVYPKGLMVGQIESIREERGGIYKNCIVRPATSLTGQEEVLCLNLDFEP